MRSNIRNLKGNALRLNRKQREIVSGTIFEVSKRFGQKIHAIAVCSNHVHVVCEYVDVPIDVVVSYYKSAGRAALKKFGFVGKVWTRGYDKRYCFDEKSLTARIDYVRKHSKE